MNGCKFITVQGAEITIIVITAMNNQNIFTFTSPSDLILEISHNTLDSRHPQAFSHPASVYQGYINQVCLDTVLPWLQELTPQAKVWPSVAALPSFWELVNGTAIIFGETRLILIPSEAMDLSELQVAQEWVDISSWAGDYYLAVQVVADDGYVRVWGYCTQTQLQARGNYNASERTYSVDASDMILDISSLAVAQEFCLQQVSKSYTTETSISQVQAQNLISRLSNPDVITPRLAIPFKLWSQLIQHGGWRQDLYQKRLGIPEQWSVLQWLQSGISQVAETIGWQSLNLQLSAGARSTAEIPPGVALSRQIAIAGQSYCLSITPKNIDESTWRFELRNASVGAAIPGGFKLRLLTEDLQSFPNNEDVATTAVELLFVEVALEPGEGIVWEVEPKCENYDREILRF